MVCSSCGHPSPLGARFCAECGAALAAAAGRGTELRKTVTVLFCDLVGSTALGETLDAERVRGLLTRYHEAMRVIAERHGGSVEKFIGDAVMAVFGEPVVREDDALRALRAALEMREALPQLGLAGRIGVATGEVVTGAGEPLATGDAVNVAARLQQAASPGEVLVGQATLAFVEEAVEVEAVAPLRLPGKAEPVPAVRLVGLHDVPGRSYAERFVGRESELATLREAWRRVCEGRRCELLTVAGDAGVGKSRLAAELVRSIDATVVSGRCLPYGEGITFWPVIEALRQLDVVPRDAAAAAAIGSLLGDSTATTTAEDIAWAFRKTLDQAAQERPLLVLFDDLQWGEQTFLDTVEHVALLSTDAPIMLLCLARPELAERHASWPVAMRLQPLDDRHVAALIGDRVPADLADRIARAASGNPLFIREMLAVAQDAPGDVVVPPTLLALLAARLDQLEPDERALLERGAVEGEVFHRGAIQALTPHEISVTPCLAALVRKELIRPAASQLPGDDGFRFRHILLRDAAYHEVPKAMRADLHESLAAWLEPHGAALATLDELLAYHLEQACHYRSDLGTADDGSLAASARARLAAAGQRAMGRHDTRAALSLLRRGAALLGADEFDLALETALTDALNWAGLRDEAMRRATSLSGRAAAAGDLSGELCARLQEGHLRIETTAGGTIEDLEAVIERALPLFEATDDDLGLFLVYAAAADIAFIRGEMGPMLVACDRAGELARRMNIPYTARGMGAEARVGGETTVTELLAWLDDEAREAPAHEVRDGRVRRIIPLAMLTRIDEARAIAAESRAELVERGLSSRLAAGLCGALAIAELIAGDPAAAADLADEANQIVERNGATVYLSFCAWLAAESLYRLDRLDDADRWATLSEERAASDDVDAQATWRQVRAKLLARAGRIGSAEGLAHEAVAICNATEMLNAQADAYADLAEVLALGGKRDQAAAAFDEAIARFQRKGNVASEARARAGLRQLEAAAPL